MQAERQELVIAAIIPQFLERGVLWFKENEQKIKTASQTQSFWKQNILILEKDRVIKPSELLRVIHDFGYERARSIFGKGEYTHLGNIIVIWPINAECPATIEFFGNRIERIIAAREKNMPRRQKKNHTRILAKLCNG